MWWVKALLAMIAYHIFFPVRLTAWLHRLRGVKIHDISSTFIAYHVLLDPICPEMIEIEPGAWITQHCKVLAHFRPTPELRALIGTDVIKPVRICRGAFIGVGSIILPGVTIGACAIVGAGSVVTSDVPPYAVVGGNPARILKYVHKPREGRITG